MAVALPSSCDPNEIIQESNVAGFSECFEHSPLVNNKLKFIWKIYMKF